MVQHPGWPGAPVRAAISSLSDIDDAAVGQTINVMSALAAADAQSGAIQREAELLVRSTPAETAAAVWWHVRRRVRFVRDEHLASGLVSEPESAEVLIRPVDLVSMADPQGDCDDFSMYVASLLQAAGLDARFVTVAAESGNFERWSHVYVDVEVEPGVRLPLDASHAPGPGLEVRDEFGKRRESWRALDMPVTRRGLGEEWWQELISGGAKTAQTILTARYANPPAGTVIQTPSGTYIRSAPGSAAPGLSLSPGGLSVGTGTLVLGGLGLLALAFLMKSK